MAASFPTYARQKARTDPPEKIAASARLADGPSRGFTFYRNGMYWRDISKVWVDIDQKILGYDMYRYGHEPVQGHVDLDAATLNKMVNLCNTIWVNPKDNDEKPDDPVGHGILKMTDLLLSDGETRRYIRFSMKPTKEFSELYEFVWKLLPQDAREAN